MPQTSKPEVGAIAWTDLTVKPAVEVRDFYAAVVGWKFSAVEMGGYSDFCMNQPADDKPVAGVCHARGENANLPAQWLIYINVPSLKRSLTAFDLDRFYPEAKRVLRPNGALVAWAYDINKVEGGAVNQLVQDYYSNTVDPYWPPERKLVEAGYRTIPFPFAEIAAPSFRMEARWTLDQLLGYFSTWSVRRSFLSPKDLETFHFEHEHQVFQRLGFVFNYEDLFHSSDSTSGILLKSGNRTVNVVPSLRRSQTESRRRASQRNA